MARNYECYKTTFDKSIVKDLQSSKCDLMALSISTLELVNTLQRERGIFVWNRAHMNHL